MLDEVCRWGWVDRVEAMYSQDTLITTFATFIFRSSIALHAHHHLTRDMIWRNKRLQSIGTAKASKAANLISTSPANTR
jgi:hypothetical protein